MDNIKTQPYDHLERMVERAHARVVGEELGDVRLVLMIRHSYNLSMEEFGKRLEAHGLSKSGYMAMMLLQSTPDNLANPSDLCVLAGETRANMTRICDELVAKGLMKRLSNEADRRRIDLSLTPAGIGLLRKTVPQVRQGLKEVLSVFSKEDKDTLIRLLSTLNRALEARL
jgi:MarR family transcriptional repressor of emrRAB